MTTTAEKREQLIEAMARHVAIADGWLAWDPAQDSRDTPNGNSPDEERAGRMNKGPYYQMTDGKGKFWEIGLDKDSRIVNHGSALFTALTAKEA